MSDFDNLDNWALRYEDVAEVKVETAASKRRAARLQTEFVRVPLIWVLALAKPKWRATWPLALYVLHRSWRYKGAAVTLSNIVLAELKISRLEKYRALAELETLGLITVERAGGKAPRVTAIDTQPDGAIL